MAGAASVLPALVVVFLVGIPMANGQFADVPDNSSPFGASSLLGPSAGGYVLVAVLAAAVAVAVTVTLMMRRKSSNKRVNDAAEPIMGADKKGGE